MKIKTFNYNRFLLTGLLLSGTMLLSSCNSSRTLKGGAIGVGAGGAIGGVIGSGSDHTAEGAIIGAAIGGTAGALIGRYMDKQAEELEADLEGATVERVGEGIKITFDSGILFAFDESNLTNDAAGNIAELAETLAKYDDTDILIEGHTDNKGSELYNQQLSEARAESVALRLSNLNVAAARMQLQGYGESAPVADNSTESGRQQNRRVEIAIMANKKLQRAAERDKLDI
ncbi:OmpA family protein [Mangrovibacterium lignilyticum]|uniref:OmpA family protein n=1 Tax=Mangrovibacterium lignilyticum TaxID=2668052 RepID=UPI0013D0C058|nr:OmpA family protein [Mangrovibacterium lignilyticum]